MKAALKYAFGIGLTVASSIASADLIFSVPDVSGYHDETVTVSLIDGSTGGSTDGLIAANVLVQFNPDHLQFVSPNEFDDQSGAFISAVNIDDIASGNVIVGIVGYFANGNDLSLLDVGFNILAGAPAGLPTEVRFRCVPFDDTVAVDAVGTEQTDANELCRRRHPVTGVLSEDYAIPLTTGFVNVLAQTTQVPAPGTAPLALLGLGLMGWMRWGRRKVS